MSECELKIIRGIPEQYREQAAELYDEAFGQKFSAAIASRERRIELFIESFKLEYAVAAIADGGIVGLAGFQTDDGSLTSGIDYKLLLSQLGFIRGNKAALIFSLYERAKKPDEMIMDGIVVGSSMRGIGIGTRLLEEVASIARELKYQTLRLDVIDANPGARRLYERRGFVVTEEVKFGYLRWILGFGGATTMLRQMDEAVATSNR